MAFFIYEVCRHPEIEAKIVEEAQRVIGSKRQIPSFDDIAKMPYFEACWKVSHQHIVTLTTQ